MPRNQKVKINISLQTHDPFQVQVQLPDYRQLLSKRTLVLRAALPLPEPRALPPLLAACTEAARPPPAAAAAGGSCASAGGGEPSRIASSLHADDTIKATRAPS